MAVRNGGGLRERHRPPARHPFFYKYRNYFAGFRLSRVGDPNRRHERRISSAKRAVSVTWTVSVFPETRLD
jgi:hypothetical protein